MDTAGPLLNQDTGFAQVDARLRASGVDTSQFGFYDQPSALSDKDLHEAYARWVLLRPRDAAYDAHVRAVVPKLCKLMVGALKADNWQGGCLVASTMMCRMLERLGIWSFGVLGSATFEVKSRDLACGFYRHDFQDFEDAVLGHAWIVIPPYGLVDATVAVQQWGDDPIADYLPDYLAEEITPPIVPDVSDVVSWRMRDSMSQMDEFLDPRLHLRLEPGLPIFAESFPAVSLRYGELDMRYVPISISLPEGPLEEVNADADIGRTGGQIWDQVVGPAFAV
ncbi:MAG: hypothetical protein WBQ60_01150 [Asticcacaulis sp.]